MTSKCTLPNLVNKPTEYKTSMRIFSSIHWGKINNTPNLPKCSLLLYYFSAEIFKIIYLLIFLHQVLFAGMQDVVPGPGIEPGSPTVRVQSLKHWATKEVT